MNTANYNTKVGFPIIFPQLFFSAPLRLCVLIFLFTLTMNAQSTKDFTQYVNPFIGTGGHGHTFPGATTPFGMVQLSPDTREDNWDGSSGYHYSDKTIWGFSHTHLSGTGIPDYCDILLMPTIGEPEFFAKSGDLSENGYASTFDHQNEKAEPGYYSVKLDEGNVLAEMTATTRVGFHRYTFPAGTNEANLILDLKHRDKVLDSELRITGANKIEGFRRSSSWAKDQIVYFVAEFSEPFTDYGVTNNDAQPGKTEKNKGTNLKAFFRFEAKKPLLVKVAISPVGITGVRRNLQAEVPHWNFEKVRADAKAAWNKELSKIEVSGGANDQMTVFYTALYHTMIHPNIFQDFDQSYRGLDKQVHTAEGFTNYTVFSLWDTFRAAHPLYTIIDQKRTVDFINTFLKQYEQGGRLPVWELAGNETDTMIGYHAVSVIADAMAKGIKGFDYEKAFEAAKHSAELNHFGLEAYKKRGYISMEDENESVSKTLEYAYNDYCIAVMALILWNQKEQELKTSTPNVREKNSQFIRKIQEDYSRYSKRSKYFVNLFEAETGFMRPKRNGGFIKSFAPNEVTFHFTEGNSWQYSFFVPQDVNGLIALHGGRKNFIRKLDELFTTDATLTGRVQPDITGLIGQYAHGNEPSHHIAYLFNYAGEPWKTQMYVRRIMDEFYKPIPDGLIGNEDCGQMSAWYVLSALGFYPVTPSIANYDLGTPIFKEAKIKLENGKIFTIKASNVSDKNIYTKSTALNGKRLSEPNIEHQDLMNGGVLDFQMSPVPVKNAFLLSSQSANPNRNFLAVPLIEGSDRVFRQKATVTLKTVSRNAKIYYTLDGTEPSLKSTLYEKPLTIEKTTEIKAVSFLPNGEKSLTARAYFQEMLNNWEVTILSKMHPQYQGEGGQTLIDGLRGTMNFAAENWLGFQGQDFAAIIDLQRETEIRRLGGGFLQSARSWIWMPTLIEFAVSNDGKNWVKVAEITPDVAPEEMTPTIKDYAPDIKPTKARYVLVNAKNFGRIPAWHPGAGFDAYIFVDEIIIK
jgi:putative alpha-1,2-mannosidase